VSQRQTIDEGLYPIRTVSEITGVNAITLRAWERRYGLLEPVRKASGHRLYSQAHIDLITRVVSLLDRGMRIGDVKAHLGAAEASLTTDGQHVGSRWRRLMDRMVAAIVQFDEDALESTYNEALAVYPINVVTEQLLTPLLRELGRRWEGGEGSVAEEHFFGCYLRNKLGARFHHRAKPADGPTLLLACLPGDRHETGLLLFALAANDAGFRTILLGADLPLSELPAAARKTGADGVVLSGLVASDPGEFDCDIGAIVKRIDCPVFVGGRASVEAFDAFKRAGVEPLGLDIDTALARIDDLVSRASAH
jgi:DNA-binding transcriptional MerR regulator/methylmalonyl-CoA mutase cobalamin-binding subunit